MRIVTADFDKTLNVRLGLEIEPPGFSKKPGGWVQAMASFRRATARRELDFGRAQNTRHAAGWASMLEMVLTWRAK